MYFFFFFDVMIGYRATEIPLVYSSKHIFSLLLIEDLNPLSHTFLVFGHFLSKSDICTTSALTTCVIRISVPQRHIPEQHSTAGQ